MSQAINMYRRCSLGVALKDSLDEFILSQQIHPELAQKTLAQFDTSITQLMTQRLRNKMTFTAKCDDYKRYDDLWTIYLDDIEYQMEKEALKIDKTIVFAVKLS